MAAPAQGDGIGAASGTANGGGGAAAPCLPLKGAWGNMNALRKVRASEPTPPTPAPLHQLSAEDALLMHNEVSVGGVSGSGCSNKQPPASRKPKPQKNVTIFDFLDLAVGPAKGAAKGKAASTKSGATAEPSSRLGARSVSAPRRQPENARSRSRGAEAGRVGVLGLGPTQRRGKEKMGPKKVRLSKMKKTILLELMQKHVSSAVAIPDFETLNAEANARLDTEGVGEAAGGVVDKAATDVVVEAFADVATERACAVTVEGAAIKAADCAAEAAREAAEVEGKECAETIDGGAQSVASSAAGGSAGAPAGEGPILASLDRKSVV